MNKAKENCEVSPDLLPVQSAESVSANYSHNGYTYGGLSRRQLISTIPNSSSSSSSDHNPRSAFRVASVNLNPAASDLVQLFDTQLSNSDEAGFFRRQQEQQQLQFSFDNAQGFQLSEDSPSPNSSGYISRSSSIEEQNRGTATSNVVSMQQSNPKLARGDSIDSSLSSSDHVQDPTPTSDSVKLSQISNSSFLKWDGRQALIISLANNRVPPGFDKAKLFHVQSCGSKITRS